MNLANRITLARIALIPLFMLCLMPISPEMQQAAEWLGWMGQNGIVIGAIIFAIAAGTDKLDGVVARKYNQITRLGKLLDPLADKLLISVALIMMVQLGLVASWIAIVIIGREIVITALRMIAAEQGIALAADRFGKLKMVLQVAAILLVLLYNDWIGAWFSFRVDGVVMWLATVVTLLSGINYIFTNVKLLARR